MFKKTLLSALITASLFIAQPTLAKEVVWKSQTIQLENTPKNIAVYDLSALDILNTLGVAVNIVPDAKFPATLADYNQKQVVKAGNVFEPNFEAVSNAKPDLIIVGARSSSQKGAMSKIAPTLDLTAQTKTDYLADLTARTEFLADLFGKKEQAEAALKSIKEKQEQLKTQTKGKTAAFFFAPPGNIMPQDVNARFGFIYDFAGLTSVVPKEDQATPPAGGEKKGPPKPEKGKEPTAEEKAKMDAFKSEMQAKNNAKLQQIVDQNPDYLIVLDRGAVPDGNYTAKEEFAKHPVLSKAKGKIIIVDANAWYLVGAGLANTELMLNELLEGTR